MLNLLKLIFGGVHLGAPALIPIEKAYICAQCVHVGDSSSTCAGCESRAVFSLAVVLGSDKCEADLLVTHFYGS